MLCPVGEYSARWTDRDLPGPPRRALRSRGRLGGPDTSPRVRSALHVRRVREPAPGGLRLEGVAQPRRAAAGLATSTANWGCSTLGQTVYARDPARRPASAAGDRRRRRRSVLRPRSASSRSAGDQRPRSSPCRPSRIIRWRRIPRTRRTRRSESSSSRRACRRPTARAISCAPSSSPVRWRRDHRVEVLTTGAGARVAGAESQLAAAGAAPHPARHRRSRAVAGAVGALARGQPAAGRMDDAGAGLAHGPAARASRRRRARGDRPRRCAVRCPRHSSSTTSTP